MNYSEVEERIKAGYREATAQYRLDDEVEVQSENHRRLAHTLKRLCHSFPHAITALDVGCGTGRYFHCLENVFHLTGMDISEEMLAAAANPVRHEEVTVTETELIRGNVYLASFPAESFDFIYSLGMFGHGCPVTIQIGNKFHDWLKPGEFCFLTSWTLPDCPGGIKPNAGPEHGFIHGFRRISNRHSTAVKSRRHSSV